MLVKICGLSNVIDARTAVECGADALGFVMGGKVIPVEVEPYAQQVRLWINELPKTADTYIVTHHMDIDDILSLAEYVNASGIQVSEPLTAEQLKALRQRTKKKIIKTVHVEGAHSIEYLKQVEPFCDYILLDSVSAGYIGGTGKPNDWNLCADFVKAAEKPVFIAGGLTLDNLSGAMRTTSPQGVDVSTGVSTWSPEYLRKDRKDPHAIKTFIQRAKSGK